jgi:hypothetical protein
VEEADKIAAALCEDRPVSPELTVALSIPDGVQQVLAAKLSELAGGRGT